MNWVLINKVVDAFGYTKDAIRNKKKKGVWLQDKHWKKAPDGRIVFNLKEIEKWMVS